MGTTDAAKIFVREQKMQFAQSILDTVMTELRGLTASSGNRRTLKEEPRETGKKTGKTESRGSEETA